MIPPLVNCIVTDAVVSVKAKCWVQHSHISLSYYFVKSNTKNIYDAVRELALEKYS